MSPSWLKDIDQKRIKTLILTFRVLCDLWQHDNTESRLQLSLSFQYPCLSLPYSAFTLICGFHPFLSEVSSLLHLVLKPLQLVMSRFSSPTLQASLHTGHAHILCSVCFVKVLVAQYVQLFAFFEMSFSSRCHASIISFSSRLSRRVSLSLNDQARFTKYCFLCVQRTYPRGH